jgi:hypothetical protein
MSSIILSFKFIQLNVPVYCKPYIENILKSGQQLITLVFKQNPNSKEKFIFKSSQKQITQMLK